MKYEFKFENKESDISKKLNEMIKNDQDFLASAKKKLKGDWDKDETKKIQSEFEEICLKNVTELKKIISEKGWNVIFEKYNIFNDAWLIVQHATMDIEFQKEFLNKARKNLDVLGIENFEKATSNLALLEDRMLIELEEPQEYGTQLKRDIDDGKNYLYPIRDVDLDNEDDLKELDFRRTDVFLEPMNEYLKIFGIESIDEIKYLNY